MEKESCLFAWTAKINSAHFIEINELDSILDARLVNFEQFDVVAGEVLNEAKELNVGGYRDHQPIFTRISNKVQHVLEGTNIGRTIPALGLALALMEEADSRQILRANGETDDCFYLTDEGTVRAPFAVDQGERVVVFANRKDNAYFKFIGIFTVVVDFDKFLSTNVLLENLTETVNCGTHRLSISGGK